MSAMYERWEIQPVYGPETSGWRLAHDCGWSSNLQDNSRTVADLVRWMAHHECEPVNKPTGFVARKPWSQIPAGWFVQAPKTHTWYEVKATRAMHSDLQLVTLADPDGKNVETRRPRDERVPCRKGTLPGTAEVADALDLFGEGAQILKDEVE